MAQVEALSLKPLNKWRSRNDIGAASRQITAVISGTLATSRRTDFFVVGIFDYFLIARRGRLKSKFMALSVKAANLNKVEHRS